MESKREFKTKMKNIKEKVLKDYKKIIKKHKFNPMSSGLSDVIGEAIDNTLTEVDKIIDKIIVEEKGDSTHDMQIKAGIHSQIKQKLGIK